MKPTVSVKMNLRLENSNILVVESVGNKAVYLTVSSVKALKRELFPSVSISSKRNSKKAQLCLLSRCRTLFSRTLSSFFRMVWTCRLMASRINVCFISAKTHKARLFASFG